MLDCRDRVLGRAQTLAGHVINLIFPRHIIASYPVASPLELLVLVPFVRPSASRCLSSLFTG